LTVDVAEKGEVLGPLEEAGALMGERNEVGEADRYANLAVGYLLQRFGDKAVTRSRRRICCPRVRARAASPFRCRPLSRKRQCQVLSTPPLALDISHAE
jgi:hypothetical protein